MRLAVTIARLLIWIAAIGAFAACERDGARDTVVDSRLPPSVWEGDARKMSASLPAAIGAFKRGGDPASDAFATSFHSGPVFGAASTYSDGKRELVVRVESGNIRERAASLSRGHANPGEAFVTRDATVHGQRATLHWNAIGKTGDVVVVLDRRFVVELRLVPSHGEDEIVALAEAMDVAPLRALELEGATR